MEGFLKGPLTPDQARDFGRRFRTGVVTLVFTDLVGSTQLKQSLGDLQGVALLQQHHAAVRELLRSFPEAMEISTAGDSFFLAFLRPSDAARFALLLHARNRAAAQPGRMALRDRAGIHLGEVVVEKEDGRDHDLHGLHVDLAARVMSLAEGGQTLLSRSAFDNARQALRGEELPGLQPLSWLNHGPYLLKGLEEPVEICEVGETPWVSAAPPAKGERARRTATADEEPVLGWRPALGQVVPHTLWQLERKLGEGGFGEVWLGRHQTLKERRVFKFCFQADRVRSLKREMTLFRLIKDRIGDHPNIVSLREVRFDQPPFYLEMEYSDGPDLGAWAAEQGGAGGVPPGTRLEIVAQIADALQAAHDAGVIHRDVKPANILVVREAPGPAAVGGGTLGAGQGSPTPAPGRPVKARLTDFGIGHVVSQEHLAGVTHAGFTATLLGSASSSHTGTHLYMAPELLAGRPASNRSDIYSLGVVLYQFLVGDFARPLTMDWARQIEDPLLREDLARCFSGEIGERFGSAAEFARNLRRLGDRHAERRRRELEQQELQRTAYRRGMLRAAGAAALVCAVIAGLAVWAFRQSRHARRSAESLQRHLYGSEMSVAWHAFDEGDVQRARELLTNRLAALQPGNDLRGFEWRYLWERSRPSELAVVPVGGFSVQYSRDGRFLANFDAGTLQIRDARTREVVRSISAYPVHGWALDFSPDSRRIATASRHAPDFKVWEVESGRLLATLPAPRQENFHVAFSPDGTRLATIACTPYQNQVAPEVRVWDLASGTSVSLPSIQAWALDAAFSPDGQVLAVVEGLGGVWLWNFRTGDVRVLTGHSGFASGITFSPDGRLLASGDQNGVILLWDWKAGSLLRALPGHQGPVFELAISADGRWLASCSRDHTARLWDLQSGEEAARFLGHQDRVWSCDFSTDGRTLATVGADALRFWAVAPNREGKVLTNTPVSACRVGYSPDHRLLFLDELGDGQRVMLWDAATTRTIRTLPGRDIAFTPDSRRLTLIRQETNLVILGATTLDVQGTLASAARLQGPPAVSRDNRLLALRRQGRPVIIDLAGPRELHTLEGSGGALAFGADPALLFAVDNGGIRTWDALSGQPRGWLEATNQRVETLAISGDARWLASVADRTVHLWDLSTQGPPRRESLGTTSSGIFSLAVSADGRNVAAGTYDGAIQIWNIPSRQEVGVFRTHRSIVWSVAFSPDNESLLSESYDSTVRLWHARVAPPPPQP